MNFAFSTLGCPDWPWDELLASAKDLGFDGIEIRGVENEIYAPKINEFLPANIQKTKDRLTSLSVSIPCFASSCYLNEDKADDTGRDYIDLAYAMNVPYVRVLGDLKPEPGFDIDLDKVAGNLTVLADYAAGKNVMLLLETNGVFAESKVLSRFIKNLDREEIGVLWDVHHPFRYFGERIEDTFAELKPYIKYLHMKDSVMSGGVVEYRMMGYGDVPNRTILQMLASEGYEGYVTLEWLKRWNRSLSEPGVVFPHFINYVRSIVK